MLYCHELIRTRRQQQLQQQQHSFAGCDEHQLTTHQKQTMFFAISSSLHTFIITQTTYLGFSSVKIGLNKNFAKRYVFANITQCRLHGLARSKYTNSTYLSSYKQQTVKKRHKKLHVSKTLDPIKQTDSTEILATSAEHLSC